MGNVKDMFSQSVLGDLGDKLKRAYAGFPKDAFMNAVFDDQWEGLELFGRLSQMAKALGQTLPGDYAKSLLIVYEVIPGCDMAQGMVFPQYVAEIGLSHLNESAAALARITQYSTCEFAVRPFIDKYPDEMSEIMMDWTRSGNEHVRRLASEGTRLAIPWGATLRAVKQKPDYALIILENLKDDPSEYVRKSVANNLNELSKLTPDAVIIIARQWMTGSKNTNQIVKHACRTLIKKAYPPAMELFGLAKPVGISVNLLSASRKVKLNDDLAFSFGIVNVTPASVKLRIGYDIGFLKSKGKLNFRANRISERVCKPGITVIERKHKMNETSTRKLYMGRHELRITINGCVMAKAEFEVYT